MNSLMVNSLNFQNDHVQYKYQEPNFFVYL